MLWRFPRSEQTIVQDQNHLEDARIFAPNLHDIGMMSDQGFQELYRSLRSDDQSGKLPT